MNLTCRCRPGCLSWLQESDELVITADGAALREHVEQFEPFPQESLFDLAPVTL